MSYRDLKAMTPREVNALVAALKEYRNEEQKAIRRAMSEGRGKKTSTIGGGTLER